MPHCCASTRSPLAPDSSHRPGVRIALAAICGYQLFVRPMLNGSCRYLPTCSDYAAQSMARYGLARGTWLALRRLSRCHPFGGSGLDPVP